LYIFSAVIMHCTILKCVAWDGLQRHIIHNIDQVVRTFKGRGMHTPHADLTFLLSLTNTVPESETPSSFFWVGERTTESK